jgi:L-alanine-DL-glutamate epimerase-like enolase superfamily enzyme
LGGAFRDQIPVYGYGMMLKKFQHLKEQFKEESQRIVEDGFKVHIPDDSGRRFRRKPATDSD